MLIFNSTIHNYADFSYDSLIHFDDGLFIERRKKKTQILILTPPPPGTKNGLKQTLQIVSLVR